MLEKNATDINALESFYTYNFSQEDTEILCENIAEEFLQKYFLDSTINNATYEKDVFKSIKKLIILHLDSKFTKEMDFYVPFAIYFFKKNLKLIFQNLSEYIMEEVAYSNHDVINFLKYYSLDTIVVDSKKYKVPQIREKEGDRWNVVSMLGILKVYVKTYEQLETIQNDIESIQTKIASFYINDTSPIEHNKEIEKKHEIIEEEIKNNASLIDTINDSLVILKNEDALNKARKELEGAQVQRLNLREEKAVLTKAKIKQVNMYQYKELVKQLESLQRSAKPNEKIIAQNQESYNSIKNSLTQALISKKQAL